LTAGACDRRLGWLDALRGVAALSVVFEHVNAYELRGARPAIVPWLSPGLYGVMVFFLVSGYIVPASLERRGSVRGFWVSRLFRLYPLWLIAVVLKIALYHLRLTGLPPGTMDHPGVTALAHTLMLQDLLGVFSIVNVLWTLSYEMVFYLLLTLFFVVRVHRESARFALGFAVIGVVFGGLLPEVGLSRVFGLKAVIAVATVVVIVGLAGVASGHSTLRAVGAAAIGGTAVVLLLFNGRMRAWEGCAILAAMFTGTVLYRAERRQTSWASALGAAAAVCVLVLSSGLWHVAERNTGYKMLLYQRQWVFSTLLAAATFALGMAWRNHRIPVVLAWLGGVSYSVYLLHPLLLAVLVHLPWTGAKQGLVTQVGLTAAFMTVLLGGCWVTYRLVEAPMQRTGRSIAVRLDARLGPDLPATRRFGPAPAPCVALAGQHVPGHEGLDQAGRERNLGEVCGDEPANLGGIIACGEGPASDGGLVISNVEYVTARRRSHHPPEKGAWRDD